MKIMAKQNASTLKTNMKSLEFRLEKVNCNKTLSFN